MTLLVVHPRRGVDALNDIGVLGAYSGTIVHDGWASYELFDAAAHAQCGAHLLRHLNDVGQTAAYLEWTSQMTEVLLGAKTASEQAADTGAGTVDPKTARALRRRYHHSLDLAFSVLPDGPPPRRRHRERGPATNAKPGTSPPA